KVRLPSGEWREFSSGLRDKRAAEEMAADHQRRIDRGEVGLLDPFEATRSMPIGDLVKTYGEVLQGRNRAPRYVAGVKDRLMVASEAMGARFLQDAAVAKVETSLGKLARGEGLPLMKPRTKGGKSLPRRPASPRTRDGYVEALRAFGSWLEQSERWGSNPFG